MTLENLNNLVKIKQLKTEPPDQREFDGMVRSAVVRWADAKNAFFLGSRFDSVYNAARSVALVALRWHGYRSDKRYVVFQCVAHILVLSVAKTRVFSFCHERRNLTKYEGYQEINDQLLDELISLAYELLGHVQILPPVKGDK